MMIWERARRVIEAGRAWSLHCEGVYWIGVRYPDGLIMGIMFEESCVEHILGLRRATLAF
jgi:hypothetical protein